MTKRSVNQETATDIIEQLYRDGGPLTVLGISKEAQEKLSSEELPQVMFWGKTPEPQRVRAQG